MAFFLSAQQRQARLLEKGWRFSRIDHTSAPEPSFDDYSRYSHPDEDPSKVTFIVPADLPEGDYQLVLNTQFTGTKTLLKEPRSYAFEYRFLRKMVIHNGMYFSIMKMTFSMCVT